MDTMEMAKFREHVLRKYAEWQEAWAVYNGDDVSYDQYVKDLLEFSHEDVEVRESHDHTLYILHPSVGDEAGWWTLYVIGGQFIPYGRMNESAQAEMEYRILAMWQVFDTSPSAVYEVVDEFDEAKGHSVPKEVWFNTPKAKEANNG
jgi:hypothetical protein